jgi:hypothetical protein
VYAKLLWLIPLVALVALVGVFTLASMLPLSSLEDFVGYNSGNDAGHQNFTLFLSIPFYYLVVFGLLSMFLSISPSLRCVISIAVTILIVGYTFVTSYIVGLAQMANNHVSGGDELMLPVVQIEKALFFVTGPLRANYYIERIEDADPIVRTKAAEEVQSLTMDGWRKHDPALMRVLAKALRNSSDNKNGGYLMSSLIACETNDREALLDIAAALKSPDAVARTKAADLFARLKPALPEVIEALMTVAESDADRQVRYHAAEALIIIASKDKRFEVLVLAAIERGEPWGAQVLYDLNTADPRVPAAFVRFLKDRRPEVRTAWLASIEDVHTELHDLVRASGDHAPLIGTLMGDPVQGPVLRTTMLQLTRDPDLSVRAAAIKAITRAFPHEDEALDAFIAALQGPTEEIILGALFAIESNNAMKDPRIPRALLQAIKHSDSGVRYRLAMSLSELEVNDQAIQLGLIEVIRDNSEDVGQVLRDSHAWEKPLTPAVRNALAELLTHHNPWVRITGIQILGYANVQDPRIQLLLVKQLTNREGEDMDQLRREAADALGAIHPLSPQAIAELKRLAQGPNGSVAETARDILKEREP